MTETRTHSVPIFDGAASRRHRNIPLDTLRKTAAEALTRDGGWGAARTLVLFAGFPRSGHSVVGALVDAHPEAEIAHELDMVGLIEAGMTGDEAAALIRHHARAFRANGQYWNGYSYAVPNALPPNETRVLGDKKGDWTLRRLDRDPALLDRLRTALDGRRLVVVNVVRNPYDNIATLSLRQGRGYDRLRIAAPEVGDARALLARDTEGTIPRAVTRKAVAEYAALCGALDRLKPRIPAEDWVELRHEDLVADPQARIADLLRSLDLAPEPTATRAAAIVARRTSTTRDTVSWPPRLRKRTDALVAAHEFLRGYPPPRSDHKTPPPSAVPRPRPGQGRLRHLAALARKRFGTEPPETIPALHLITVVGVDFDLSLLPHFLRHYIALGVPAHNIHVILNAPSTTSFALLRARFMLRQHGAARPEIWIGPYSSTEMWRRRAALQAAATGPSDWVLSADVDELQVWPEGIAPVLTMMERRNFDYLHGPMIDRLSPDGTLARVARSPDLFAQFPRRGDLMCQISRRPERRDRGGTLKVMLCAAALLPGRGGHHIQARPSRTRARDLARITGLNLDAVDRSASPDARRLKRCATGGWRSFYGMSLSEHPTIKDPTTRLSVPIHVAHFKWHAGLMASLARRRMGHQTPQGQAYSDTLAELLADGPRIDPAEMAGENIAPDPNWREHAERLRAETKTHTALLAGRSEARGAPPEPASDWRLRQLTYGSAGGLWHVHSYYDIPVLDPSETRIAAIRSIVPHRPLTPEDTVDVGWVDTENGGFSQIGTSGAWSWQQGPLAQWVSHPNREAELIWNDREDGRFVARICVPGAIPRRLERPVYAVAPDGITALGLSFARLETMRPAYGYAIDAHTAPFDHTPAPENDGIWHINLETGTSKLILSLAYAHALLVKAGLPAVSTPQLNTPATRFWFNHIKIAPGGRRFTVKLRWRQVPDGRWHAGMGVSLTCGLDGSDPRIIARGSSHVIWWDDERLYFWSHAEKRIIVTADAPLGKVRHATLGDGVFDANIHIRHIPADPQRMIYDAPYAETVALGLFDSESGRSAPIASFPGHRPARGQYRCDLHPVPAADGQRIVISSLNDGARQIWLAERVEKA